MDISLVDLQDFKTIFSGSTGAFGIHIYSEDKGSDGKKKGKTLPRYNH